MREWNASGRPLITALQEYFKAPEEEIDPEQARRLRAAGALGDSLKILAEMYGDGQNATIRNRYNEASGMEKAEAEVEKATARYQQLLEAHNKLMGSAAMDEIGRVHNDMMGDYLRGEQEKAQQAQAERARDLTQLKEEEERKTYGAKKAADLDLALQKYEMIDKPVAAQAQQDKIALEGVKNKHRLGQIYASGAEARKTKSTPYAVGGGRSGATGSSRRKSTKNLSVLPNGNYSIRLESRATPWTDDKGAPISDPMMRRQGNMTVATKDVEMTPEEYEFLQQKTLETVDAVANPDFSPYDFSPAELYFWKKLEGTPEKDRKDIDYLTRLYAQCLYDGGEFAAPRDLLHARGIIDDLQDRDTDFWTNIRQHVIDEEDEDEEDNE